MYTAGIMNHFFDAPKMELIVWGSTMGIFAFSAFRFRSQFKIARSEAEDTKPGSTGPHTNLDFSRTIGTIFLRLFSRRSFTWRVLQATNFTSRSG